MLTRLIFICIIHIIVAGCIKGNSQQRSKNIYKTYELEKYLNNTKLNALYKALDDCQIFINDVYDKNTNNIDCLISDLEYCIDFQRCRDTFKGNFKIFKKSLQGLSSSGLLQDLLINKNTLIRNKHLKKWIDSIRKNVQIKFQKNPDLDTINPKMWTFIVNEKVIDSKIKHKTQKNYSKSKYFNVYNILYYAIYHSSKESEEFIRDYIINRIEIGDLHPILIISGFKKHFNPEELQNPLMKMIIFTEYMLPILYNYYKE